MANTLAILVAKETLGRIFFQRCFYLFVILLAFDVGVAFVDLSTHGRLVVALLNVLVIVAAVAAVGRSVLSFVFVTVLAVAALVFFWQSLVYEDVGHLVRAYFLSAALDFATIVYLLRYVFRPEVMTRTSCSARRPPT